MNKVFLCCFYVPTSVKIKPTPLFGYLKCAFSKCAKLCPDTRSGKSYFVVCWVPYLQRAARKAADGWVICDLKVMHMTIEHCGREMHPPCLTGHRHLTEVIMKKALHNGRLAHPWAPSTAIRNWGDIALFPLRPRWPAPPSLLSQTAGQCIQRGTWAAHSPDWSAESSGGHSTVPFIGQQSLQKEKQERDENDKQEHNSTKERILNWCHSLHINWHKNTYK